jgi:uncharacterized protein YdgA (DUF945 family)
MNRRKLVGVAAAAVVLSGAYVGATAYTGHKVAAAYEAELAQWERQSSFVHVVDHHEEKGLLSAVYSASVRFGCTPPAPVKAGGAQVQAPDLVRFTQHVHYGPLPGLSGFGAAVVDLEIHLPATAPERLRQYIARLKPSDLRTRIGYGGAYRTTIHLPNGEITGKGGIVSWKDIDIAGSGTLDGGPRTYEATLPELALRDQDAKSLNVKLADLHLRGDNRPNGSYLLRPGKSSLEIGSVDIQANGGKTPGSVQLTRTKFATELVQDKELMNYKASITTNAVLKLAADAKPMRFTDIEWQESIQRLHAPTLQKVFDAAIAKMSSCGGQAPAGDGPEAERAAADISQLLVQLLPHNPRFALDKLALSYEGHRGELSTSLGVQDFALQEGDTLESVAPRLQETSTMHLHAKVPASWLSAFGAPTGNPEEAKLRQVQTNALLDMATANGYIVRNGDDITTDFSVEHGLAVLNGKPLPGVAALLRPPGARP